MCNAQWHLPMPKINPLWNRQIQLHAALDGALPSWQIETVCYQFAFFAHDTKLYFNVCLEKKLWSVICSRLIICSHGPQSGCWLCSIGYKAILLQPWNFYRHRRHILLKVLSWRVVSSMSIEQYVTENRNVAFLCAHQNHHLWCQSNNNCSLHFCRRFNLRIWQCSYTCNYSIIIVEYSTVVWSPGFTIVWLIQEWSTIANFYK